MTKSEIEQKVIEDLKKEMDFMLWQLTPQQAIDILVSTKVELVEARETTEKYRTALQEIQEDDATYRTCKLARTALEGKKEK